MLRVIPHPPRTMFNGNNNMQNGYSQPQNVAAPYGRQAQQPEQTRLPPQAISHIYKSCTNLFLTRRLPEALAALQPVVNDPSASIRQCPRALRIKFWGLYLAILDAAAKMTVSEGKATWGAKEWPELVAKIRSGAVWDEVNRQYGDEGRVDADVVVTLATLLLSHSPEQSITQKKIEAYLGAVPSALSQDEDPKSMMQRSKITELYCLHVLPRVGDWDYAKEFTQMSTDIDDEQREVFFMHLDKLKADMETRERETRELEKLRDQEIEEEEERLEHEHRQRKSHSRAASVSSRTSRRRGSSVKPAERSVARDETAAAAEAAVKKRLAIAAKESKKAAATAAVVPRATGRTKPNTSLITSTTALLSRMQAYMTTNSGPFSMLQTIVMLAVIAWMTNNKRMRDKIRRFLLLCWIKIAKTVGMGMKVTYV